MTPLRCVQRLRPLRNKTCVYCHKRLTNGSRPKDHVLGRRFVPTGSLEKGWNVILDACCRCNNEKGDLENDISAITMLPDLQGKYAVEDEVLIQDAQNKAQKSVSRRTRKKVADSHEEPKVRVPFGRSGSLDIGLVCPPQMDRRRVYELCRLQIAGFFYFLTYNEEVEVGYPWLGDFMPLLSTARGDWGHPLHVAFMEIVRDWEIRVVGTTAREFFKVAVRKHPSQPVWSWALEWNQNFRSIGFLGEHGSAQAILDGMSYKQESKVWVSANEWIRLRAEVSLDPTKDELFVGVPEFLPN